MRWGDVEITNGKKPGVRTPLTSKEQQCIDPEPNPEAKPSK
jgi:hypothetical protein